MSKVFFFGTKKKRKRKQTRNLPFSFFLFAWTTTSLRIFFSPNQLKATAPVVFLAKSPSPVVCFFSPFFSAPSRSSQCAWCCFSCCFVQASYSCLKRVGRPPSDGKGPLGAARNFVFLLGRRKTAIEANLELSSSLLFPVKLRRQARYQIEALHLYIDIPHSILVNHLV